MSKESTHTQAQTPSLKFSRLDEKKLNEKQTESVSVLVSVCAGSLFAAADKKWARNKTKKNETVDFYLIVIHQTMNEMNWNVMKWNKIKLNKL